MSVPEGKRSKNRLEVQVKAQALASYTVKICSNKNVFKPEFDDELVRRIKACAYDICVKLWSANNIRAETSLVDRRMRYELQEEAILLCDQMLVYIGIARSVFHLKSKRMKYWTEQILAVKALAQKWKESDVSRYGKP